MKKIIIVLYKIIYRINSYITKLVINTQLKSFNKNLCIYGNNIILFNHENISIGENCRLNEGVLLHGAGGIEIGDNVTFSARSSVFTLGYDLENWVANYNSKNHIFKKVKIASGTWIGAGVIILPGVQILGRGVIIGAGSVVTKNIIEDFVIVAGSPAKVIRRYT